jgi:hypothetical protein
VLAPAVLAPGIALLTEGDSLGIALAVGVALACVLLSLLRWPAAGLVLALAVTGAGYGLAYSYLMPASFANSQRLYPGPIPALMKGMSATGLGGPRPVGPAVTTHVTDLEFDSVIGPLLTAAVDPDARAAFVTRADGSLDLYSYPEFKRRGTWRLPQPGYRAALDGRRGRLYLAVSDPKALQVNPYGDRPVGRGDLHVYDVAPLLRGGGGRSLSPISRSAGPDPSGRPARDLRPLAVVPLDGDVARLTLSPDREDVYYLLHRAGGDTVGRLAAANLSARTQVQPPGPLAALAVAPQGRAVYAAGGDSLLVLDPTTLAVRQSIPVEATVHDLAADGAGRVFLAESGQWTLVSVLDTRRSGEVVGRWESRLHGRVYLGLSADGARLYLGSSSLVSNLLRALQVSGDRAAHPRPLATATSDHNGPIRGEFFVSPDGLTLINRWGKVFRLAVMGRAGGAAAT